VDPAWAWRTLGLDPGSPATEVRRVFRVAAQLLHPDRASDLGDDVRAEAHRRMVELAEAYRICLGGAPGPRIAVADDTGLLPSAGEQAGDLLDDAKRDLATVDTWERARAVVTTLEQVAHAWPGTTEGDEARVLLVTSVAATMALSARERAGHLTLSCDYFFEEGAKARPVVRRTQRSPGLPRARFGSRHRLDEILRQRRRASPGAAHFPEVRSLPFVERSGFRLGRGEELTEARVRRAFVDRATQRSERFGARVSAARRHHGRLVPRENRFGMREVSEAPVVLFERDVGGGHALESPRKPVRRQPPEGSAGAPAALSRPTRTRPSR